jgi:hypothetical protein
MSNPAKRMTLATAGGFVAAAVGLWSLGAGIAPAHDAVATSAVPAAATPAGELPSMRLARPSRAALEARPDYVSADGRYVVMGPVEISAAVVVTRDVRD